METSSVAVIGAGLSGTMLTLQLLRHAPADARIYLIERTTPAGSGLAYSTCQAGHLLNVPAARMSAFADKDSHFLDWLKIQPDSVLRGTVPAPGTYVPRRLYGTYARDLLRQALSETPTQRLTLLRDEVTTVVETDSGLSLRLASGGALAVDAAVLASGNFAPTGMPAGGSAIPDAPAFQHDPWDKSALSGLDPHASVLLIGTGLTMVDAVITLLDSGHTGRIHAVSRRGLLPRAHAEAPVTAASIPTRLPKGLGALTRWLRQEIRRTIAAGGDWRAVVDGLRPHTTGLWQSLSADEQARFLRHLRPWWDVHRHRMAPEIARRIDAARASGQLRIQAGRIEAAALVGALVDARAEVTLRRRGSEARTVLLVDRVMNCTGPAGDITRIADPLIRSLLRDGLARADAHRLGLDVTDTGAVRDWVGAASGRLFALGPLTKGKFWEITAVPDIRRQCAAMAEHLGGTLQPAPDEPADALLAALTPLSYRRRPPVRVRPRRTAA
jgi:uncharacterized NAD(P)/FAD-binding protein YdhS